MGLNVEILKQYPGLWQLGVKDGLNVEILKQYHGLWQIGVQDGIECGDIEAVSWSRNDRCEGWDWMWKYLNSILVSDGLVCRMGLNVEIFKKYPCLWQIGVKDGIECGDIETVSWSLTDRCVGWDWIWRYWSSILVSEGWCLGCDWMWRYWNSFLVWDR